MDDAPNVVWVTLESVRADRTTPGGYRHDTTPNLQRIAQDGGDWFARCFAHDRWTPAASASILTGTYPSTHQVGMADTTDVYRLGDGLWTLPELLAEEGYRTACFSSNPYVSPATGLDRGFDRYHGMPRKSDLLSTDGLRCASRYARNLRRYGGGLTADIDRHKDCIYPLYQAEVVRRWLREFAREDRPYFLYTHFNSSHHPYDPPRTILAEHTAGLDLSPTEAIEVARDITNNIWREVANGCAFTDRQRAALRAVYDAEIAFVDALVGELYDELLSHEGRDTILVVTGDHGELFGEQGMLGHNLVLHDGLIHVPLLTWGLDGVRGRTDDIVQHIDVSQTIVARAGGETAQFQGHDLRSDAREYALVQRGPRASDLERIREFNPAFDTDRYHRGRVDCLRSTTRKLLRSEDRTELFELPDEETDVSQHDPGSVARFTEELERLLADVGAGHEARRDQAEFSEAMERHLEELGYR